MPEPMTDEEVLAILPKEWWVVYKNAINPRVKDIPNWVTLKYLCQDLAASLQREAALKKENSELKYMVNSLTYDVD